MLSFDSLPSEVLLTIAYFVGSDYLLARADKLLLCKSCVGDSLTYLDLLSRFRVARPVAYRDLTFAIETVDRYLAASKSAQDFVETCVRTLTIDATETHDASHEDSELMTNPGMTFGGDLTPAVSQNGPSKQKRCVHVKESLVSFASQLKHMYRMESFRLVLFVYADTSKVQDGLYFTSISKLLSNLPPTLSSLTIDNGGTPLNSMSGRQEGQNHFCSLLLNQYFMPSLRHLRIRTRNICPEVFQSIQSSRLESLIVSLSLMREEYPYMSKVFYAKCCLGFSADNKDLYSCLVEAAKATIPQLPYLKTLRMIRHKLPLGELSSFDVLSDKIMIFAPNADWEALDSVDDGETDPDCTERSNESFSTTDSIEDDQFIDLSIEQTLQ